MPLDNPSAGVDWASEYQVSAIPWVTASSITLGETKQYEFRYVSKYLEIRNSSDSGAIAIAFTPGGLTTGSNYLLVEANETRKFDVRVKEVYISGSVGASCDFQLLAGLTGVPAKHFPGIKMLTNV